MTVGRWGAGFNVHSNPAWSLNTTRRVESFEVLWIGRVSKSVSLETEWRWVNTFVLSEL